MTTLTIPDGSPVTVHLRSEETMSDEAFFELCAKNRELRIERAADGEVLIMSPTGAATSRRNFDLAAAFAIWAKEDGTGLAFDSSGGFRLPNGATRSPDLAWVACSRLEPLDPAAMERFLPLCPDFVVELRSPSDPIGGLREKMEEYVASGARLGWLIDPLERRVEIYRPSHEVEHLEDPDEIGGEPILPGFVLELGGIWNPF